ncbi:MAG TPA: hypothetical protein VL326_12850 [Kofleriaceae bacterium]|jgi:hypothetical protein|nr:hypothetical protein [Kofleriaceae bacterium]
MMKMTSLSLILGLALVGAAGCADSSTTGDDMGGGDGSGSQEPQPEPQMDAQGTYRVNSTFDIATNMPGTAGTILNGIIDATDSPDDPMSWLLDQMLAQMSPGTLKDILVAGKPFVAGYLNDRLHDLAPDLMDKLTEVGQRMAQLTKHFGLNEKLQVSSVDQTYIARVTADGVRFTIDGTVTDLDFLTNNIDDVVANDVFITYDKGASRLGIGDHTLPLPYGKIVRLGLDVAVIPAIDPNAHNLGELIDHAVNCAGVGQSISDALGFGSAAFWGAACHSGVNAGANLLYNQIADQNAKLSLQLVGSSRAADTNNDYKLDKLLFGTWQGSMTYDADNATLAQPAEYDGARM